MRASLVVVAAVLGSPLPGLCAGELALVGDGKALSQIAVPAQTVPSVECAARELQHHVRKAREVEGIANMLFLWRNETRGNKSGVWDRRLAAELP